MLHIQPLARALCGYTFLMRCLGCQYDLKHLAQHRCPECGKTFDPGDPATFDPSRTPIWSLKIDLFVLLASAAAPLIVLWALLGLAWGRWLHFASLIVSLVLVATVTALLYVFIYAKHFRR
jgi:hypothetical protein